jgi:hypothetical protein
VITNLDRLNAIPEWRTCDLYECPAGETRAADHFDFRGGFVSDIKVPADPTNLTRQEELTHLLMKMKPIYAQSPQDRNGYIESISHRLNVPIAITSAGATALEKDRYFVLNSVDQLNSLR